MPKKIKKVKKVVVEHQSQESKKKAKIAKSTFKKIVDPKEKIKPKKSID